MIPYGSLVNSEDTSVTPGLLHMVTYERTIVGNYWHLSDSRLDTGKYSHIPTSAW